MKKNSKKSKKIEFKHCNNFGLSFAFCCGFYQYGNVCWSGSDGEVFIKGEGCCRFTVMLKSDNCDPMEVSSWTIYDEENPNKEYTLDEFCAEFDK